MGFLADFESPVVFCHNDLQEGNVLELKDGSVTVLDYEFGGNNFRGFDFGNLFCEMVMDNQGTAFPGFVCQPDCYPDREAQLGFFRAYAPAADDAALEKLMAEADAFAMASHWLPRVRAAVQRAVPRMHGATRSARRSCKLAA